MFLSCPVRVWEWIHALYLPEYQGNRCSEQAPNLKFKWLQLESSPEPLSLSTNTQRFGQTGQMTALCSYYLSLWWIWLYVLLMSITRFRVNPHSIVALMSWESSLKFKWWQLDSNPEPLSSETNTQSFCQIAQMIEFWVLIFTLHLTVCSCHVTYAFQSESTRYSCLNLKELLDWSRCKIGSLSDCNWTRTKNRLVRKRTLNHFA